MHVTTSTVDPSVFFNAAILVTRPGSPLAVQWIVDSKIHGPELAHFQQTILGGAGTMTEHEPAKGARNGFHELFVPVKDVAVDVIELLPHRLRAAIAAAATAKKKK